MPSFAEKAISFYRNLEPPPVSIPEEVEVMNPVKNTETMKIIEAFYRKFYADRKERIFLIGINPGRFGGGITGIPFTDPVNLEKVLGIENPFEKKHELSSRFVYEVVESLGGPEKFFGRVYLTAVSPLGFIMNNKNLNYYDVKSIREGWEKWMVEKLNEQIAFGANQNCAFSMGRGKNLNFLNQVNDRYQLFDRIEPLPHPRWVMQYRFRDRKKYIDEYCEKIKS